MRLATLFAPLNYLISSAYYWSGALVGLTEGVWYGAISIVQPAVDHGKSRSAEVIETTKVRTFETVELAKARAAEVMPEAVARPLGLNKTVGGPLTTPDGPQVNGTATGFQPMSPPMDQSPATLGKGAAAGYGTTTEAPSTGNITAGVNDIPVSPVTLGKGAGALPLATEPVQKPVLHVAATPTSGKTASPTPLDRDYRTAVPPPTNGLVHNVAVMDAAIDKPTGTLEGHALDHADDTSDDVSEDFDDPARKSLDGGSHSSHKTRNAIKRIAKKIGNKVTPHSPSHASHAQAV